MSTDKSTQSDLPATNTELDFEYLCTARVRVHAPEESSETVESTEPDNTAEKNAMYSTVIAGLAEMDAEKSTAAASVAPVAPIAPVAQAASHSNALMDILSLMGKSGDSTDFQANLIAALQSEKKIVEHKEEDKSMAAVMDGLAVEGKESEEAQGDDRKDNKV